jgi:hypothetical protein
MKFWHDCSKASLLRLNDNGMVLLIDGENEGV